jgi:hypothetical protein
VGAIMRTSRPFRANRPHQLLRLPEADEIDRAAIAEQRIDAKEPIAEPMMR